MVTKMRASAAIGVLVAALVVLAPSAAHAGVTPNNFRCYDTNGYCRSLNGYNAKFPTHCQNKAFTLSQSYTYPYSTCTPGY